MGVIVGYAGVSPYSELNMDERNSPPTIMVKQLQKSIQQLEEQVTELEQDKIQWELKAKAAEESLKEQQKYAEMLLASTTAFSTEEKVWRAYF
jgi:hypothetical protein